jgi:hypothetical protein
MGNDGGSIPKRGDMVKVKVKAESYDKDRVNYEKWNLCALTMEPLIKPVVACRLGRLYNKESVLNVLLDRGRFNEISEAFSHLTSLKDVKELNIKENTTCNVESSRFVCLVTGKEMNGKTKFFYYRSCGCVLSYQAIEHVEEMNLCVFCSKPVGKEDRIVLNGTSEEVDGLRAKLTLEKSQKKPKKAKEKRPVEEVPEEEAWPKQRLNTAGNTGEILALKRNKNIDELYSR